MKNPILIVIDMQQDFLKDWAPTRRHSLVNSINELLSIARSSGCPVVWVRQEFEPDLRDAFTEMRTKGIRVTIKGTSGSQIIPELSLDVSEAVVIKKRYSAFFGTNLDQILGRRQPDVLILAGINTHACIRTTAIDAYQRDLHVVLASDCVDSYDREHHDISLRYMQGKIADLMSNSEIRNLLHRV